MANRVANSKPGPNGSRLLYDEKGRYLGRSVENAVGNQIFLDSRGNYAGRCKSGPGNHRIIVSESRPSETGSSGGAAQNRQKHAFCKEFPADVETGRTDRAFYADLTGAFRDAHQHRRHY